MLKELRKIAPEINRYFTDIEFKEVKDEGPVLSAEGIRMLLRAEEGAFGHPAGMLSVADVSALPDLIEGMMNEFSSSDMVQGWVVRNDLFRSDHHIVPVFAVKVKGKTHVFILDSLGHDVSSSLQERQLSFVLEDLIQHFRKKPSIDQRLALYSYKNKRQHATSLDCVAFSLLDLKNLAERHIRGADNLVIFFEKQSSEHQPRSITSVLTKGSVLPIFEIDILPPELMKVTQSKKQLAAYEINSPALNTSSVPVFQRFNASGQIQQSPQTLEELKIKVSENERVSDERAQNLYVTRKRLAQTVHVIARHYFEKEKQLSQSPPSSSSSSSSSSTTVTSPSSSSEQPRVKSLLKFKTKAPASSPSPSAAATSSSSEEPPVKTLLKFKKAPASSPSPSAAATSSSSEEPPVKTLLKFKKAPASSPSSTATSSTSSEQTHVRRSLKFQDQNQDQ